MEEREDSTTHEYLKRTEKKFWSSTHLRYNPLHEVDTQKHTHEKARKRIWVWPRAIVHSLVISPLARTENKNFAFQGLFHNGKTAG